MFIGIIPGAFPVESLEKKQDFLSFWVQLPSELLHDLQIGASVAIDGVCLTVVAVQEHAAKFDVMGQTLLTTTLADLQEHDLVHVERSVHFGAEIGGHILSGHIDAKGTVVAVETPPNNYVMTVEIPKPLHPYIFQKGFLALHGASLTIADWNEQKGHATFYLIPETVLRTTFGKKRVGDDVNIEIDRHTQAIVDTVKRTLASLQR